MRKTRADTIRLSIDELRLSIPGISSSEGKQLANEVVSAVKTGMDAMQWDITAKDLKLETLHVRLKHIDGQSIHSLADNIAKQILTKISLTDRYGGVK